MTIKQTGGIFGRNPSFNEVSAESVDINGGSIDGVTIGSSSAGSGSFTTLTASDDVNFDSGTFFVDASADTIGIGTATPAFPLSMAVDSPASEVMIDVGNTKYNSTNSSGESKIRFGWSNHGAANIAAYKQSTNLTGFKVYTELGFNVANLALTIDSSGNLTPAGNLVVASGNGIDFSATSGAGTSELFDDYEEGTWTPTFQSYGGTPTNVSGKYTKIGDTVFIHLSATFDGTVDGSTLRIQNVPFSSANSCGLSFAVNTGATCTVEISGSNIEFKNSSAADLSYSGYGASAAFELSGVYYVS